MMDIALLERANPIYNIAKMALCGLALAGDRDAGINSEKQGLMLGKSQDRALSFLADHGLKAERMTVGCYMPKIESLSVLKSEVIESIRMGMEQCTYWRITLSEDTKTVLGEGDNADFKVRAMLAECRLDLYMSGRMDTLTAPQVLEIFEKKTKASNVDYK